MCLCACMSVCVCVHASVCVRVLICFVISLFTQLKKNRRDWRRKDWRKRERRRRDSRMKGKSQRLETSSDEGELLYARKSTTWSSHARTVRLHSLPLLQGTATCRFTTMFAEESTSTGVTCPSRFPRASAVVRHRLIHVGVSPFRCTRCSYICRQSGTLGKHLKICCASLPD